jgi:hypothetical protein
MKPKSKPTTKTVKVKHTHPYNHYLKEIRPTWKKRPEYIKNMITDMVEKKGGYLIERADLMEFIERFMDIHKEKIMKIRPELFDEIRSWVTRQKINYISTTFLWFRKVIYEHKYWINKDYHLAFLDREIELISRVLKYNNQNDVEQQLKAEILKQFQNGDYPDTEKYDPYIIGKVMALIQYLELLNVEKKKLLQTDNFTTAKVPVEFKNNKETNTTYLQVQIPPDFFAIIQKDLIHEELKSYEFQAPQPVPDPKLYTPDETAEIMQITTDTLRERTNQGIIKGYRIGGTRRKRYRWEDIQNALVEIETGFSRRVKK